jgi:hypothetical protein
VGNPLSQHLRPLNILLLLVAAEAVVATMDIITVEVVLEDIELLRPFLFQPELHIH